MGEWFLPPRVRHEELMDRPDVAPVEHLRALAGLQRINFFSRAASDMRRTIMRHLEPGPLDWMDVACGSADVPVAAARQLRRCGYAVRLTLCDRSETCLQAARQRAAAAGFEPVTTARLDATAEPLPVADLVTCSLFLHHLERGQVVEVLQRLGQATGRLLVINDLERSRGGLLAAWLACRLLTRSPIVRYDGPVSARAAWSRSELRSMAEEAGLTGATVASAPAWRMRLVWRRP